MYSTIDASRLEQRHGCLGSHSNGTAPPTPVVGGGISAYNSHIKPPDKPIWEALGAGIWLGADLLWGVKFYLIEFLTNQRYFK